MKHILLVSALLLSALATGQNKEVSWKKVEASELNLVGKAFDTPNPYHRIDTTAYKGFDETENRQCRMPAGLAILFKTDARTIGVSAKFGNVRTDQPFASYMGFDLYIKKDGKWLWAGRTHFPKNHNDDAAVKTVVDNMAQGEKECILYLPIQSELYGCQVCVPEGNTLESLESPFRHKIVFHGSSFTHGISTTRAGMSYPMQFMRRTGMQVIPLGFSGHCRMQPYFATVIEDIEADAYVFDPFSNLSANDIKKRFMPFFERVVASHPDKPIIIQRTIYWEHSNFDTRRAKTNVDRWAASDSLLNVFCKNHKNVYYIKPDAALHNGESSTADGVHPNDNGYSLWEASIEKPVLKILRKYGIK